MSVRARRTKENAHFLARLMNEGWNDAEIRQEFQVWKRLLYREYGSPRVWRKGWRPAHYHPVERRPRLPDPRRP